MQRAPLETYANVGNQHGGNPHVGNNSLSCALQQAQAIGDAVMQCAWMSINVASCRAFMHDRRMHDSLSPFML